MPRRSSSARKTSLWKGWHFSRQNAEVKTDIFFAVIFIAAAAGILIWSGRNAILALASRRWPQAEGTIVVSDLQRSKDDEGGYTYRPEVSYRYNVAGQELVGNRVRFGDQMALSWSAPAVRVVRQYKVDTHVRVRYDPNDPQESVLETGINGMVFAGIAISAAFLILGIFWLRSSW